MADLSRDEAERLLAGLRKRRDTAIDEGDVTEVDRIDAKIAEVEAALADLRTTAPRAAPSSEVGPDNRTRNIIIAVVAVFLACGICGTCADSDDEHVGMLSAPERPDVAGSVDPAEPAEPTLVERVGKAEGDLDGFDPGEWDDSEIRMAAAVATFAAYADLVREVEGADSVDASGLRAKLIATQRRSFPRFRDAYGPIIRAKVWENDMDVRTAGSGYRTIQYTAGLFAANRNIAEFQRGVESTLKTLRFKRAEYRWYRDAREFTYYSMESPADDELVGVSGF